MLDVRLGGSRVCDVEAKGPKLAKKPATRHGAEHNRDPAI
jgi:hypothetical protein